MKDGFRQNGRNCLEQWVKGIGFRPVCWKCDIPMDKLESQMYRTDYKCPTCNQMWYDEQIH